MSISKEFLSGSTNGRPIEVAQTATAGTLLHTASASAKDEVWLWATNNDTEDRVLTIEFGGVTATDDHIVETIPAKSTVLVVPGAPISNSLAVRAFAAAANVINCFGHVNRIS